MVKAAIVGAGVMVLLLISSGGIPESFGPVAAVAYVLGYIGIGVLVFGLVGWVATRRKRRADG